MEILSHRQLHKNNTMTPVKVSIYLLIILGDPYFLEDHVSYLEDHVSKVSFNLLGLISVEAVIYNVLITFVHFTQKSTVLLQKVLLKN